MATANGASIDVEISRHGTRVELDGDSRITDFNIRSTNGVIHVISISKSIAQIASGNGDYSTLVELLSQTGLVETLSGRGNFTVFAPTSAAFATLGTVKQLKQLWNGIPFSFLIRHSLSGIAAISCPYQTEFQSIGIFYVISRW